MRRFVLALCLMIYLFNLIISNAQFTNVSNVKRVDPHPVTWCQFDPSHFQIHLYTKLFITRFCAFKIAFGGLCLGPLQNNLKKLKNN